MLNGASITIVGNVGVGPELRYTTTGKPVSSFTVAVPLRRYDTQAGKWITASTSWYRVISWDSLAENVMVSLARGTRVIVNGNLSCRNWTDKDGAQRETWEISADAIGPDLSYATAAVTKPARQEPASGPQTGQEPAATATGTGAPASPPAASTEPAAPAGAETGEPGPPADGEPAAPADGETASGPRHRAAKTRR